MTAAVVHKTYSKSTAERLQSNRRNALRSTGPRSQQGKQQVSLNAIKHGLSVPLPPSTLQFIAPNLVALIESEGIDRSAAEDLALKILDYERNQEFALRQYADEIGLALDPEEYPTPERTALDDTLEHYRRMAVKDPQSFKSEAESAGLSPVYLVRLLKLLNRDRAIEISKERALARKSAGGIRFLKRSSNQLIKAIKALAVKS